MQTFNEIEEMPDKIVWCKKNIGLEGNDWSWDLDLISYEERTGIIIKIDDDEMAMAFKLRWK